MWKITSILQAIVVFFCLNSFASYDQCKDILRDGVRDTLSNQDKMDRNIAQHYQFCSIAKDYQLNENSFRDFAKDYAKSIDSKTNSYGGGASVGWGPFSFGGNYSQSNNNQKLSSQEKEDLLAKNSKEIIEYYRKNCGNESYEESLKLESVALSKIANPKIVQAWRDCMLNQSGFFADLISSSSNANDNKELEYTLTVQWKSNEGTEINSIELRYSSDKVSGPYQTIAETSGFVKTINICDYEKCVLKSGGNLNILITHKDTAITANISIIAKTNTGMAKSHVLVLPKLVVPEPITTPSPTDNKISNPNLNNLRHSDEEMVEMINNLNLGGNGIKHSDNYMRDLMKNLNN